VNVHPQKAEVRFADARSLYDAVTRELHVGLARAYAVPVLGPLFRRTTVDGVGFQKGRPDALRPDTSEPWRFERAEKPESGGAGDPWGLASEPPPVPYAETGPGAGDGADVAAAALFEPGAASSAALSASTGAPEAQGELLPRPGFYGALRFLAQVRNTFLLCEGDDGLYILDQHAAAERVTFARLRRAFASRAVAMQKLLVAEVVELSAAELALVEERSADIAALGVELSPVGTSAVAVHGVPKILSRVRPTRIVRDVVAELGRFAKRPFGDAADLVLATMACHGSVRAGDAMAPEEARALLVALDEVDFAGHCPHGRPIVTRLRYDELERRVGR
jgi:DNA mismatch repair protein MutL